MNDRRIVSSLGECRSNLPCQLDVIFNHKDAHEFSNGGNLKPYRELGCEEVIVLTFACCLVLKIILEFYLYVWREAIRCGDVDSAKVWTPLNIMAVAITDRAEELLVPANRAKELRRKLIFCFDVVSECICVANVRNFEARFIKFGPDLQMMPGETGVLPKNKFAIIIDVASGWQRRFGFAPEIRAFAC